MKTNLVFKKQVTEGDIVKTVTRIVPVDVPYIASGEGWILSGHTDVIETTDEVTVNILSNPDPVVEQPLPEVTDVRKFLSGVQGTAKLVRSRGIIKIVARKEGKSYYETTPNSVCINDFTKTEFFKNCREIHGNSGIFQFSAKDGRPYDYWNTVLDAEYTRQKNKFLNKQ